MIAALIIVLLLLFLFGGLGAFVAKAFFIGLAVVLVIALASFFMGGGLFGRGHSH
jgi:hypothetical protein